MIYLDHYHSHPGLLLHYRGRAAAERQERRHLRGLRRPRQPDGIRSTRRGQRAFQSHDLVRGGLHDHVDYAVGLRRQARRPGIGAAGDKVAAGEDPAGNSGATTPPLHRSSFNALARSCALPSPFDSSAGFINLVFLAQPFVSAAFTGSACNCICRTSDVPSE